MVKQNVGPLDRVSRAVLGSVLIGGCYFFQIPGIWGGLGMLLGAVWILEAMLGYCLFYDVFSYSTKRKN